MKEMDEHVQRCEEELNHIHGVNERLAAEKDNISEELKKTSESKEEVER